MSVEILVKYTNNFAAELGKSVGFELGSESLLERTRKLFQGQGNRRTNILRDYF